MHDEGTCTVGTGGTSARGVAGVVYRGGFASAHSTVVHRVTLPGIWCRLFEHTAPQAIVVEIAGDCC